MSWLACQTFPSDHRYPFERHMFSFGEVDPSNGHDDSATSVMSIDALANLAFDLFSASVGVGGITDQAVLRCTSRRWTGLGQPDPPKRSVQIEPALRHALVIS
ncbi:phosphoglycolate phosphatase-like protein [Anopheles sinensis]|uniref:Phosphoglycolate phosphatase-like protein n=1 Tax=Anopheles sinensis TaxID=74873 RepID=A0A084VA09_ANOSI|nr:phosphoglycolate phosphatase-like protein [Anopheles sinensis]